MFDGIPQFMWITHRFTEVPLKKGGTAKIFAPVIPSSSGSSNENNSTIPWVSLINLNNNYTSMPFGKLISNYSWDSSSSSNKYTRVITNLMKINGNTLFWYSNIDSQSSSNGEYQFNYDGKNYCYTVILIH